MVNALFREAERCALEALIYEVEVTPKPGLVDKNTNGAHSDMNASLFIESARVVSERIGKCAGYGYVNADLPYVHAFQGIRRIGLRAEREMLLATGGINTHKGAIFAFSIIACAYGRLTKNHPSGAKDLLTVLKEAGRLSEETLLKELIQIKQRSPATNGERAYLLNNIEGARGEAISGFRSIAYIAYPAYMQAKAHGANQNDAGVYALLHLIARVNDTCLIARGGMGGLAFAQSAAQTVLKRGGDFIKEAKALDREFTACRLSPGGSADLLGALKFLLLLTGIDTRGRISV